VPELDVNYNKVSEADQKKAKAFFEKGASVGAAGQYDFAVQMYVNGLRIDPDAVDAHQALREIALRRKASGGKGPGMFAGVSGKDDKEKMVSAAELLAKDPGSSKFMIALMEHAYKAGYYDTVLWIAPILYRANNDTPKPDYGTFQKVRDHFARVGRYAEAVEVCQRMVQMRPDDMDLRNELKNLSAEESMRRGKYGTGKSFRESVRDMDKQQELMLSERDQVGEDYLQQSLKKAEAELAADPTEQGKMTKLVDALLKVATPEAEDRALIKLDEFYQQTGAYRFKHRAHEIRLKQLVNEERAMRAEAAKSPNDAEVVERYKNFRRAKAEEELAIFQEVADQYPTESKWKYEVAQRLAQLGRFDEAIPMFQQARNDPKLRNPATLQLGTTFLAAGFQDEAVDTIKELMESYPAISTGDDLAKEIYYWHGRSLEAKADIPNALRSYSQVVKWDFNYKDVQGRMKKLRAQPQPQA